MKKSIKNLFNLKNKIIVITGGSGFLGSEFSYEDFIFNIQYMYQELTIDDSINITDNVNYSNSIDCFGLCYVLSRSNDAKLPRFCT